MRTTKKELVKAINDLIIGYKNDMLLHTMSCCPLCIIYGDQDLYSCSKKCFNSVFTLERSNLGCLQRIRRYYYLNWNNRDNKLVEYWEEILELVNSESIKTINKFDEEFRNKILSISDKYKYSVKK